MAGLILMIAAVFSAGLAFAMNWLALTPWRRARDQHWSERARLYHPVRIAATSSLWALPAVVSLAVELLWPDDSPHWGFTALIASLGTAVGTIPLDREVFPRIGPRELWRQSFVGWLIRFLLWLVFLTAIAVMPERLDLWSLLIAMAVVALCIVWNCDGWLRLGKILGLYVPPPARLQSIVDSVARRMNIQVAETLLIRVSAAQAFAIPGSRKLLFSERILELLTDDELASICAHELAHLTETRVDYLKRHVVWLMFLPWLFLTPLVTAFGALGFFMLLGTTLLAPILYRKVSHPLEERADRIAKSAELDEGTYARALVRLYQDNLAPAVNPKSRETHPHLYDRMISAGVTPDFPRPAPAEQMAWTGRLLSAALGLLAMLLFFRSMNINP